MIYSEKEVRKIFSALLILVLSGLLGIFCLYSNLVSQKNVLFPVLTGLFGLSTLMLSVSQRSEIPPQQVDEVILVRKRELLLSIILGSVAGLAIGFLPAIGVSEAATIVQYLGRVGGPRNFLVTLSGINVGNEVFSLISLYLIGNPRSGASVAIQRLMGSISFYYTLLLIGVILFSGGIAAIITLFLAKKFSLFLKKLNYKYLCIIVICSILFLIFIFTGINGLLITFTSTSIGLLCARLGVRRSHCMGCLLIPSLLFFSNSIPFALSILKL